MDPNTGNIYTKDEAEDLGLEFDELIPLEDEQARFLLEQRKKEARKLMKEIRK